MPGKKTSTFFGTPVTMIHLKKTFFIADFSSDTFFLIPKDYQLFRVPAGQTISAASPNIWLRR
jgi:hypothetical protein